jgi:hypothetical protein
MMFETVYPEPLQFELLEKKELWDLPGSIFVWMFVDGKIAGESYGTPTANDIDGIGGSVDLPDAETKNGFHCYSNTILPGFQGQGLGMILKAHWLGLVAGKGFDTVYGHARPGRSQALNAKFGAEFLEDFPDWFGTGEEYRLYRLRLR